MMLTPLSFQFRLFLRWHWDFFPGKKMWLSNACISTWHIFVTDSYVFRQFFMFFLVTTQILFTKVKIHCSNPQKTLSIKVICSSVTQISFVVLSYSLTSPKNLTSLSYFYVWKYTVVLNTIAEAYFMVPDQLTLCEYPLSKFLSYLKANRRLIQVLS